MNIREHEPICRHTTLRTGGPARFFIEAASETEIRKALKFAQQRQLPLRVLGGGSNVLASDEGFAGALIKVASRGIAIHETAADAVQVITEAGEEWDQLVEQAVRWGLCGLETLSLIPGTVGGAVIGNIGAYGAEVRDTLAWVEAVDARSGTLRRFAASECELQYRQSWFKTAAGRHFVVVRAAFQLRRNPTPNMRYKEVADLLERRELSAPTLRDVREAVIAIRRGKLPDLSRVGTAGSFFKNPVISRAHYDQLASQHPGLPGYPQAGGSMKVPLGWILDRICHLKGIQRGRVGTHPLQALVIVNAGGTAAEVEALADEIVRKVKETTAIHIEWEVEKI